MPKIRIIAVRKNKDRWVDKSCANFEKLLSRFADVAWEITKCCRATPAYMQKASGGAA